MISLHCDIKHLVRIRWAAASTKKTLNVCRVHMQVIFEDSLVWKESSRRSITYKCVQRASASHFED